MKLPRDLSGVSLAQALKVLGYDISRQTGSHIRLTTFQNGEHHVTVPAHNPIKIGTLAGILADIARHHEISRDELLRRLGL
jgi:predicted RNA binding protein YcfA (HicA-like mRNA interferase family)